MVRKKAVKPTETRAEMLDKLFAQVDAEVLLAGVLGATATLGGITPPLTRLLQAVNENVSSEDFATSMLAITGPGYVYVTTKKAASWIADMITGNDDPAQTVSPEDKRRIYGLAAAGAMEGMMMMSFMKNREAQKVVVEAFKGAADLIPSFG